MTSRVAGADLRRARAELAGADARRQRASARAWSETTTSKPPVCRATVSTNSSSIAWPTTSAPTTRAPNSSRQPATWYALLSASHTPASSPVRERVRDDRPVAQLEALGVGRRAVGDQLALGIDDHEHAGVQRLGERAHRIEDRLARDILGRDDRAQARLLGDDAALLAIQRLRGSRARSSVTSRLRARSSATRARVDRSNTTAIVPIVAPSTTTTSSSTHRKTVVRNFIASRAAPGLADGDASASRRIGMSSSTSVTRAASRRHRKPR